MYVRNRLTTQVLKEPAGHRSSDNRRRGNNEPPEREKSQEHLQSIGKEGRLTAGK